MTSTDVEGDDRSLAVIATVSACLIITTIMVSVRLYTRVFLVKQVGPDDYMAIVTLALIYGLGLSLALNTINGLGKHTSELAETDLLLYKKYFYATLLCYTTSLLAVKTTLLTQYYRLFSVQSRIRTLYVSAILLVIAWSLSQVFLAAFVCVPVSAFWNDSSDGGGRCLPPLPLLYTNAAGNIATEVAVLVLPLPVLGRLNLPTSQRTMLVGIFSLGFITVIISIVRIRWLDSLADYTYETVPAALLSLAELTTALTCACLLTLRPIITRNNLSPSQHQVYQHTHKRGDYLRHSGVSTTAARSSYSSHQQQQSPRQSQTPPRRGSAAIRYLASMESREGLYDDKYMLTASSYELEHIPTPTSPTAQRPSSPPLSPPAAAVISTTKPTCQARRRSRTINITSPETPRSTAQRRRSLIDRPRFFWSSSSEHKRTNALRADSDDWRPGSSSMGGDGNVTSRVTTEIGSRGSAVRMKGKPTPKWEIGVQTTVYQTYQSTYLTTAVR